MKPIIGYLASSNYDDVLEKSKIFQDEHSLVQPYFESLGFRCDRVDWQDSSVDWTRYTCLIPKAVWNYFDRYPEFVRFLDRLKKDNVPLRNPLESVTWNMNKGYLLDLSAKGIPIVPLRIYLKGAVPDASWFAAFGDESVLVKPAVSGGSKNTVRFCASRWKDQSKLLATILAETDLIVQPFAREVESEGEYSFFFFGGVFSHAILKKPRSGDFRAHSYFGAELKRYEPSSEEISAAYQPVTFAPARCCYARTDMIRIGGVLHLIELEIIEPYLYMEFADNSNPAKAFAHAVVESL